MTKDAQEKGGGGERKKRPDSRGPRRPAGPERPARRPDSRRGRKEARKAAEGGRREAGEGSPRPGSGPAGKRPSGQAPFGDRARAGKPHRAGPPRGAPRGEISPGRKPPGRSRPGGKPSGGRADADRPYAVRPLSGSDGAPPPGAGIPAHVRARQLAADVVARADREHPADAVLRDLLREQADATPALRREASRATFAYYRWRNWLDSQLPLAEKIRQAQEMDARFRSRPGAIPAKELLDKSLPSWVRDQVKIDPAWLVALQSEPRIWLRARLGQGNTLAKQLGHCRICGHGRTSDALEYRGPDDLFRRPEFEAGAFELQDLSSQAVGWICDPQPGETWWDACAGEGGKTLHLSDLMRNRGLIWASDRAEWRLKRLRRRAARARAFNYRVVEWDGGPRRPMRTLFDGVLVDAPCAGIGTWHRNPHARWTTTMKDVHELAVRQLQLLQHVGPAVKPGGRLVYAVCSVARAETTDVVGAFESRHPEFEPLPVADPLRPGAPPAARIAYAPQDHGGNGMFVAVWKRKPEAPAVTAPLAP